MAVGAVPNTAGIGLEEAGVQLDRVRPHPGQPGRAHLDAVDLRGRRLQRLPAAGIRRLDAGTHGGLPRDGRRGHPDRAAQRDVEHLHAARGRDGRLVAEADRAGDRAGRDLQAAAAVEPARQDDGHQGRLREAVRAAPAREPSSAVSSSRPRRATSSCRSRSRSSTASRSTSSRAPSASTPRSRARSPTPPARCTSCTERPALASPR